MFYNALLYPLLLQVALSFCVLFVLFSRRVREFKRLRIHPDTVPTRTRLSEALQDSAAASDNFQNQFELPVLFFVAVLLAITLLLRDPLLATLAWTFVALPNVSSLPLLSFGTNQTQPSIEPTIKSMTPSRSQSRSTASHFGVRGSSPMWIVTS